ncbi:hypothetical protein CDD83_3055 [Cordyceps sp. RAO-2017]|nr:hypothetical protein CDD83_3055 [Cordyceps sp. RAO-2017]
MYTASFAFFEAIREAGITHCFVNLGSDHPSMIEAMVKGQREAADRFPRIITCPSEMVAMSMADGFARRSGRPQCVIVHVDVGTQALGPAVHNASVGRAPILVFAGISPVTLEGEMRGSRSEFIHWMQDIPDQKAILGQYCRYAAEIKTGVNIKQMVNRALQFATSQPQGPVYLCGAREVMEAEIEPYSLDQALWGPVRLGGLPADAASTVARALARADRPLLVTGYSGRNHAIPRALTELADAVATLRVLDTGGCDMCLSAEHPAWLGTKYGVDDSIAEADVIVVLDCDVPWIPTRCKPRPDARVFHIDVDPLKQLMPLFYVQSESRFRADALASVEQILAELRAGDAAETLRARDRAGEEKARRQAHASKLASIGRAAEPLPDGRFGSGHLSRVLRAALYPRQHPADAAGLLDQLRRRWARLVRRRGAGH